MPTLADLNAAEQKMDGHGVGGVFAEAAKREAEAKAEDLSVSGATRADREKLLAGLRDAPARERRWAAAREGEGQRAVQGTRVPLGDRGVRRIHRAGRGQPRAVREPRRRVHEAAAVVRRGARLRRGVGAGPRALQSAAAAWRLRARGERAGRRVCGAAGLRAVRSDRGEETHEGGRAERRRTRSAHRFGEENFERDAGKNRARGDATRRHRRR